MKARARRVYGRFWSRYDTLWTKEERDQINERLADHMAHCSRSCCGNPRRNGWAKRDERITMQERKFLCDDGE